MQNQNEAGFTLIETLITVLVISLLMLMPVLSIKNITESIQVDLFFRELTSNITIMQNHAILTGEKMKIEFVPRDNLIRFNGKADSSDASTHPLYREMHLQEGLYEFVGESYGQVFFYGHSGNISSRNGWTKLIQTSKGRYNLVFWLGSGRFEIQKVSS